jgi:hypothetical protein
MENTATTSTVGEKRGDSTSTPKVVTLEVDSDEENNDLQTPNNSDNENNSDMTTMSNKDGQDKKVEDLYHYQWLVPLHSGVHMTPITLSYDLDLDSVYAVSEQLLKSHTYSAVGAALYLNRTFYLWIDFPYDRIQKHSTVAKVETQRIYWDGQIKSRKYFYLHSDGAYMALSPSFQKYRFLNDQDLVQYGLQLKMEEISFSLNRKVRCLALDIDQIKLPEIRQKLQEWLDVDEEERESKIRITVQGKTTTFAQ